MKKIFVKMILVLLAIVILLVLAGYFWMNSIVKKGIELAGPKFAKVETQVDGVSLSLFSGKGSLSGLVVGNPQGYQTPTAIRVGSTSVAVKPASVFSDKIVVQSVNIQAPEITFEGNLSGNNLKQILANLESESKSPAPKDTKKIQVDDLVISGGKIHLHLDVLGGKTTTLPLPDIHLTQLGTGPRGMTAAELTRQVLQAVLDGTTKTVAGAAADLGKNVTDAVKNVGQGALEGAGMAAKGITDLFKKK
jgi:hypothetical protein